MQAGSLMVTKLALGPSARCKIIAAAARSVFTGTWLGHRGRSMDRDWAALSAKFQNSHPKCVNAAIRHDTTLCGMATGAVNQDRFVALDFLEGNPNPMHPLKGQVIGIVLTMAEAYRQLIGVPELRLHDVDPNLIPLSTMLGFALAPDLGGPHHIVRR